MSFKHNNKTNSGIYAKLFSISMILLSVTTLLYVMYSNNKILDSNEDIKQSVEYNEGKSNGYSDGYSKGQSGSTDYNLAFLQGNNTGYVLGYTDGYYEGFLAGYNSVRFNINLSVSDNFSITAYNNISISNASYIIDYNNGATNATTTTYIMTATTKIYQSIFIPYNSTLNEINLTCYSPNAGIAENASYTIYTAYYDTVTNKHKPFQIYQYGQRNQSYIINAWQKLIFSNISHQLNISDTSGNLFFIQYNITGTATLRPAIMSTVNNSLDYNNALTFVNYDIKGSYNLTTYENSYIIDNEETDVKAISIGSNHIYRYNNIQEAESITFELYNFTYDSSLNGNSYYLTYLSHYNMSFNILDIMAVTSFIPTVFFNIDDYTLSQFNDEVIHVLALNNTHNITINSMNIYVLSKYTAFYVDTWNIITELNITINNSTYLLQTHYSNIKYLF